MTYLAIVLSATPSTTDLSLLRLHFSASHCSAIPSLSSSSCQVTSVIRYGVSEHLVKDLEGLQAISPADKTTDLRWSPGARDSERVSSGKVARTPAEARAIAEGFNGSRITKPQTLKSSKCSTTDKEDSEGSIGRKDAANTAEDIAKNLLGHQLKAGRRSRSYDTDNNFFTTESIENEGKWYLAITFDRENYCPSIVASKRGGFDIETTAEQHPKHLDTFKLGYTEGITPDVVQ
ncbi:succinyl-CoA synthetase subunit beta, partial [Colletotrichum higginsianum]